MTLDKDNAWVLGVCAGLAAYWRTDPAVVRVGVVVAGLFFAKTVIAAYLMCWLLFDEDTRFRREDI